jgi:hypothetical protein
MAQTMTEGWCTDPYGLHEARWMSAGTPTKLVRDGSAEQFEAIPASEPTQRAVPLLVATSASHGMDLRRSDQRVASQRTDMATAASRILTRFSD